MVSVVTATATKVCEEISKEKVAATSSRSTRMTLPTLSPFTGKDSKGDGESFNRWI